MGRHDTAYDGTDPNYYDHQLSVLDESAGRGRYDNELASLDARFGRGALGQGAVSEPQPEAQYQQQPLPPFQSPQMSPYQPSPPPQMPSPPQPEAQYQQQPLPPFDPQPMSPYQPSPQEMPEMPVGNMGIEGPGDFVPIGGMLSLYPGSTTSPNFFDTLSRDEDTFVSPRQVLEDSYGSPNLFDEYREGAQAYREDNPRLSWMQQLDDGTLNSHIPVRSREEGGGAYFSDHKVAMGRTQEAPLPYLQGTLQHEVGGHGTQGLNVRRPDPLYTPGVGLDHLTKRPPKSEGWGRSPEYQFQRHEVEARLRGYQQEIRREHRGGAEDAEDPTNSRTYLDKLLRGWDTPYDADGFDHGAGLPEAFQKLSPKEQLRFLDYWAPRMPGLVQNGNLGMYGSVG